MSLLDNKVAYVSGGGSGIGKAIALCYAREGAKVALSDINEDHGKAVVDEIIKNGGEALFILADSSKAEDNERIVKEIVAAYGRLDVACNNAGIGGQVAITGEYAIDAWDKVIALNLNGVFYACRYQLEQMEKNGGGSIVNMASIHGTVAAPMSPAYTASKHGVVGLTKNIAAEYGQKNIRCNAVGPGYIATPLLDENLDEETKAFIASKASMNRLGKAEEIAELVVFLNSDKSSFTTGGYFIADGGYTAV
ncbi:SDR family oxidoreductase [Mangrovimonas sp. AS39]|uniref:SDR family NAD(P)-dependent oxidoreductase n=1 Tax=Mangrovimonas futianensis TaxID=2895523 RepID=UPI001E391DF5|nr:glucose 1-dehydrogenase [Mangrovimonas futianensis]MCF1191576.1 SDR family oxidoreductase [Mangrovimonas futianensis]MCF1195536.1 SDR family oxidoreductase [Mangrovimonas futianensis]